MNPFTMVSLGGTLSACPQWDKNSNSVANASTFLTCKYWISNKIKCSSWIHLVSVVRWRPPGTPKARAQHTQHHTSLKSLAAQSIDLTNIQQARVVSVHCWSSRCIRLTWYSATELTFVTWNRAAFRLCRPLCCSRSYRLVLLYLYL